MTALEWGEVGHGFPLGHHVMGRDLSSIPSTHSLFPCLTPAGRPLDRTLVSLCGPCLSVASWRTLRRLASAPSHMARQGVTVYGASRSARPLLGTFAPHKGWALWDPLSESGPLRDAASNSTSPAVARPGNTENCLDIVVYSHSK